MTPDDFLAVGQATGIAQFMHLPYAWACMESLHFIALAVLLGSVGVFDVRMLGLARGIPVRVLHRLVPFGIAAYLSNVATGLSFFLTFPDQYLYNPAFQTKIALMIVAGINVAAFYGVMAGRALATPAGENPPLAARVMAGVSLAAWLGVIACGRLITVFRPPEFWCIWC